MGDQPRSSRSRRRRRGGGGPPRPNSILDGAAVVAALEGAGMYPSPVRPMHVAGLYQALHRQHYPDLPDFVRRYRENERALAAQRERTSGGGGENPRDSGNRRQPRKQPPPLKNAVSSRKNANRVQLPGPLLDFLRTTADFVTVTSRVRTAETSADGSTTKLAVELHDGFLVESVIMRYVPGSRGGRRRRGGSGRGRASLCVSSQCGCAMGCTFCATGTMGWSGNLTAGEILEQVVHADRLLASQWEGVVARSSSGEVTVTPRVDLVRNVVFMGMGEPLDNYHNVVEACKALIDNKRWNLAHGRVTVSTVGIPKQIRRLTRELPEVSLALSLHAPTQEMRVQIVPTAKRYPIEQLIDALDEHMMAYLKKRKERLQSKNSANGAKGADDAYTAEERIRESTRRRAMIEYVMLEGPTSTVEAAHALGRLVQGRQLVVNLIPYNQTDVKDKLRCPSDEKMDEFRRIVASYGTFCTVRRTMGADIASACGQLITKEKEAAAGTTSEIRDIEDVASAPGREDGKKSKVTTGKQLAAMSQSKEYVDKCAGTEVADLERWIRPLAVAMAVAASCFLVSTALLLKQQRSRSGKR